MTKMRLYEKDNTSFPKGTIIFNENYTGISIRFGKDNIFLNRFKNNIKKFLKDNNLIIVSQEGSRRKHSKFRPYDKTPSGFDTYTKEMDGSHNVYFRKVGDK